MDAEMSNLPIGIRNKVAACQSSLPSRAVTAEGIAESFNLDDETWKNLQDISKREGISPGRICTLIRERIDSDDEMESAAAVFVLSYYRALAHESWKLCMQTSRGSATA